MQGGQIDRLHSDRTESISLKIRMPSESLRSLFLIPKAVFRTLSDFPNAKASGLDIGSRQHLIDGLRSRKLIRHFQECKKHL